MPRIWTMLLAMLTVGMGWGAALPVRAQQPLYDAGSSDIMSCPGQGPLGRQLLERHPGHFGCGVLENIITPPLTGGYATIAQVQAVAGRPRVRLYCPADTRPIDAGRQAGAVVIVERPFDPRRQPGIANALIRDAMRRLYARCPTGVGGPSMGFVQLAAPVGGALTPIGEVRTYGLGIWFHQIWGDEARRTVSLRGGASAPGRATAAASAPMPWITVASVDLRPSAAEAGGVRGRLGLSIRGGSAFTLRALSNGAADGLTDTRLAPNQCTQLIVRYAAGLGLRRVTGTRDVGDGKDVAFKLSGLSDGRLLFHDGAGAAAPPKPGAVISIGATDLNDAAWRGNPYGHVGIAQAIETISDTQLDAVLFDQNFPLPAGRWKRVRFVLSAGRWTGTMSNSARGETQLLRVSGWANPVD